MHMVSHHLFMDFMYIKLEPRSFLNSLVSFHRFSVELLECSLQIISSAKVSFFAFQASMFFTLSHYLAKASSSMFSSGGLNRILILLMLLRILFPRLLLSRFSRVRLSATPQTAAHQAPLSLGISRQEHWSGVPLPSLQRGAWNT